MRTSLPILPLVILVACSPPTPRGDAALCDPGRTPEAERAWEASFGPSASDTIPAHEALSNCIKVNAYVMAASPDPVGSVADAVIAACHDEVHMYALTSTLMLNRVRGQGVPEVTVEQIEGYARSGSFHDDAVAAAMRTRAGHCHG